jgi:hypothetical protein
MEELVRRLTAQDVPARLVVTTTFAPEGKNKVVNGRVDALLFVDGVVVGAVIPKGALVQEFLPAPDCLYGTAKMVFDCMERSG